MAGKNFLSKLHNLEGAVVGSYNPHDHVLRSPSPSVNFAFGKGHGLPLGFGMCLYGPPKGGKSVLCNSFIGQMHRDYADGIAIKFDTEFREAGQLADADAAMWGIDRDRYVAYSVNSPMLVFDRIEKEIAAYCQDGMPLKLVIIDSLNGIQGRRAMNADTIETQQIGDHALTIQEGLKRILAVQHKYNFAVILTCHVRAEMDMLEQKRGNKVKMAAAFGVQHYAEYFAFVEPNRNKEGRTDLSGNEFTNEGLQDLRGKADQVGHKIFFKMKDSSCGPKGRTAEFTLNYTHGFVNTHEEIFLLGKNRGVITRPNNTVYVFGEQRWTGAPATLNAIKENPTLAAAILAEVKRRDQAGAYTADDVAAEAELEEKPISSKVA